MAIQLNLPTPSPKGHKRVVVSCGPIPAKLDAVKYITNRFHGGLALKTAKYLQSKGHEITIIAWKCSQFKELKEKFHDLVLVDDVFEYYDWFVNHAKEYDAFVMAAAVANLTPANPIKGKFPSHRYKPGDPVDIPFIIAPRAIDAIKALNPTSCLIGYKLFSANSDEELIEITQHTLKDAKANIIFANHPATAKEKKIAVMPDGSAVPCTFEEHLELMNRVICAEYYHTEVKPLAEWEQKHPDIQEALATVAMFEKTFPGYGTVAVPVDGMPGSFATTSRGHETGPVLVRYIDPGTNTVHASGKATLNAPTMQAMLHGSMCDIVVHRHQTDPMYSPYEHLADPEKTAELPFYVFPGTVEETGIMQLCAAKGILSVQEPGHGYLKKIPIRHIDWNKYYEQFPSKYFGVSPVFMDVLKKYKNAETLEVGGNRNATGTYAYDPYVQAEHAKNLSWEEVKDGIFDLSFIKNAINYLTLDEIKTIAANSQAFIANTFFIPPEKKVTECEAVVKDGDRMRHTLWLKGDAIMRHQFHAYTHEDYESLRLKVTHYGTNSALVTNGLMLDI